MSTSTVYEENSSSKAPTFDGKVPNWQYYKVKMESYLARLDLSELLDPSTVIAQDAHGETDDKEKKAIELLQKKNRKAPGILLNSIDTKTPEGKATFRMIQMGRLMWRSFQTRLAIQDELAF